LFPGKEGRKESAGKRERKSVGSNVDGLTYGQQREGGGWGGAGGSGAAWESCERNSSRGYEARPGGGRKRTEEAPDARSRGRPSIHVKQKSILIEFPRKKEDLCITIKGGGMRG